MKRIPDRKKPINISWWNINKRFYLFNQNSKKLIKSIFDNDIDMIFISETNLGYGALPSFDGYTVVADTNKKICTCGGIAWYVKNHFAKHISHTRFNDSYISFRLDIAPKYVFIGAYIQPEGARHFKTNMFADVGALLAEYKEKGLIPFIGGDFNSRLGDFNTFVDDESWKYAKNVDDNTNNHGRTLFKDICVVGNVKPINGMKFNRKTFMNEFTFLRSNGKSQIDFCLTNEYGRRQINRFDILSEDWHISEHRPIKLQIEIETGVDVGGLIKRADDLNRSNNESTIEVQQFKGSYDIAAIEDELLKGKAELERSINQLIEKDDIQGAIDTYDEHIKKVHRHNKTRRTEQEAPDKIDFAPVNESFEEFLKYLSDPGKVEHETQLLLEKYIEERKKITKEAMVKDNDKWNEVLKSYDARTFWRLVDWKGSMNRTQALSSPTMKQFEVFFEDLYKCSNQRELYEIMEISTDSNVPALDQPIDAEEIKTAFKDMKKPGFDYKLPILSIFVTYFMALLVTMMNAIFSIKYPVSLAYSLLSLIPKKGNLMLPKNYRGVQMMKTLACLYDRIITNRLKPWLKFHIDQTAFQKGKSTLIHIFTLRILIDLARKLNVTLYIGSVDIEKAFDHVPRSLLLKKLVKLGVGKVMLFALKQLYLYSMCVIKFQGELSEDFRMYRGVRQGAASSVLFFISFMDDLFEHLEQKCSAEVFLNDIHVLIHADDTIILSTNRDQFIHKCNEAINFFHKNKLNLNIDKSCFLIINPGKEDRRSCIILKSGVLSYKSKFDYLGVIVSDTGVLKDDVKSFIVRKNGNVSVKYTNFCKTNKNAPLHVKLEVLEKCAKASLIYGCETWGANVNEVERCYRAGLKIALNVRQNLNNEIVHIESGKLPLRARIKSMQLKFWVQMKDYVTENPHSALAKVYDMGTQAKSPYLNYYQKLETTFGEPKSCEESINEKTLESYKEKIRTQCSTDNDSKLGTYFRVNPNLASYVPNPQTTMEFERELTTRFRTGSHSLAVETGRYSNIPRENRLCSCGRGVQTVWHVIKECPTTRPIMRKEYNNLQEVFEDENIHGTLFAITKKLKIQIC